MKRDAQTKIIVRIISEYCQTHIKIKKKTSSKSNSIKQISDSMALPE